MTQNITPTHRYAAHNLLRQVRSSQRTQVFARQLDAAIYAESSALATAYTSAARAIGTRVVYLVGEGKVNDAVEVAAQVDVLKDAGRWYGR